MNNLNSPDKNKQELLKAEDKQLNSGYAQRIYSNCVSTHDDACFLDIESDLSQY